MKKIDNIPWQKIRIHNPTGPSRFLHLRDPKEYFRQMLAVRKNAWGIVDSDGIPRQTGRTTHMILKALADIKGEKKVVIVAHNSNMCNTIGTNLTDYGNQINMNLMYSKGIVMQRNMDNSLTRDVVYLVPYNQFRQNIISRTFHSLYVDNAVQDISFDLTEIFYSAIMNNAEVDFPRGVNNMNDQCIITSDGEEFRVGDLFSLGEGVTGMITDILFSNDEQWPTNVWVLMNGQVRVLNAQMVEMMEKCVVNNQSAGYNKNKEVYKNA